MSNNKKKTVQNVVNVTGIVLERAYIVSQRTFKF